MVPIAVRFRTPFVVRPLETGVVMGGREVGGVNEEGMELMEDVSALPSDRALTPDARVSEDRKYAGHRVCAKKAGGF